MDPCGTPHRRSAEAICHEHEHGISYWIGMTYTNQLLHVRTLRWHF